MKTLHFDEKNGTVSLGNLKLSYRYPYHDFVRQTAHKANLIMGVDGNATYALSETVSIFGQQFRVVIRFRDHQLAVSTLLLVSGPVKGRLEQYPSQTDLEEEFNYLLGIYKNTLHGTHIEVGPLNHCWEYGWGKLTLLLQPQGASVITDINWND